MSLVWGRNGSGDSWTFPAGDTTRGARESLLVLNPNGRALALRATFYLSDRATVRRYAVPARARYTLRVGGGVAPALAGSAHAVQLTSDGGQGFVAEQSIYDAAGATAYGTAGLAR